MLNCKNKDKTALIEDRGNTCTYGELKEYVRSFKKINNIKEKSLVFILCENNINSIKKYIACIENNIVPLLLDSKIESSLLKKLLEIYEPNYIFYPDDSIEKTSDKNHLLNDSLSLLLTTSGSMGSPKLVRLSYENIKTNADAIISYLEISENERAITTLPMNYTYGLSIINTHLIAGATILLTSKSIMQKEFYQFFREEKATSFGGVPYTYEVLKRLHFFNMELSSLRYFTQAGGKLSKNLHKEFAEYALKEKKKFIVMYGQTEATARMSYLPYNMAIKKIGSIGIAIPGGKFELKNKNVRGEGELIFKGKNVSLGYAEDIRDLKKGDERKGVLETGDIAKVDSDGFYYIIGRKKRFLKLFGNRINLDEVETLIKSKFNIECAVSGEDDKMKLYIIDKTKKAPLKDFVSKMTGIHFSAFEIIVVLEIPKNEAGKILYKELSNE
jgi:acyl-coenzyme A synthetase/AMP-(fatty) acid ligase